MAHAALLVFLAVLTLHSHQAHAYAGAGQAINPDGACAAIPCYQEVCVCILCMQ